MMTPLNLYHPKVFISYSWDSPEHKQRVFNLSERLRQDGIDCNIDEYEMVPGHWQLWMIQQIKQADFVLVVCTEAYRRRAEGEEEPGKGHGVIWEAIKIMTRIVYDNPFHHNFIPIVFDLNDVKHIPFFLSGVSFFSVQTEEGYQTLYRYLTDQLQPVKSELGELKITSPVRAPNPYIGLAAFQEQDANRFFGRESLVETLWQKFSQLYQDSQPRILPLLGPSGSGKSSLARAGLIPQLKRQGLLGVNRLQIEIMTPTQRPIETLAKRLAQLVTQDPSPVAKTLEFEHLMTTQNEGLRRIVDTLPHIDTNPFIILIDQFEEAFTLCQQSIERTAWINNLIVAASDPSKRLSLILTLRSDFLRETQYHLDFNQIIAQQAVIIPIMSEFELRATITKPAEAVGLTLDDATVELLIEQTKGREGALPLLQVTLTEIWEGMRQGLTSTETLKEIGGVGGALSQKAEKLYQQLSDSEKKIAQRAFLKMVQLGEGSRDTRRRIPVDDFISYIETQEQIYAVLENFVDPQARLITLSQDAQNKITAEITHETLLEHWTTLREWLTASREDLRFEHRLDEAAKHWYLQNQPDGLLWRSPDLDLLRQFHKKMGENLTPIQIDFFKASDDKQRQAQRLKKITLMFLVLLMLISVFESYNAQQAQNKAKQAQNEAESLLLTERARQEIAKGDVTTGILLLLEALPNPLNPKRPDVLPVADKLYEAVLQSHERQVILGQTPFWFVDFSPEGQKVVVAEKGGRVQLWDIEKKRPIYQLIGHTSDVYHVDFSPEGRLMATASDDGTSLLWAVNTGQLVQTFLGHTAGINHVTFNPSGTQVITSSRDNTARLWDVQTGQCLQTFIGHTSNVNHATFSPDGQKVVTSSFDNTARLWDVQTGILLHTLRGHTIWVYRADFSPAGHQIVTASEDNTARLWDTQTGHLLQTLVGHTALVYHANFSPDGQQILTSSADNTARLWESYRGRWIQSFIGHTAPISDSTLSPEGQLVMTASEDHTIRLWKKSNAQPIQRLSGHTDSVYRAAFNFNGALIATASQDQTVRLWKNRYQSRYVFGGHRSRVPYARFSPNGTIVATASFDNTARLWQTSTAQLLKSLAGHRSRVSYITFNPKGTLVATTSLDNTTRLWDVSTGECLQTLVGHTSGVNDADFSPDGQRIVTASRDNTARLWDVQTGQLFHILKGHTSSVNHARFSPNGDLVATSSFDNTARLWDVQTGQLLHTLIGHTSSVNHVSFNPAGTLIVTSSRDNTAHLWEVSTGRLLQILSGHTAGINHAHFSHDGQQVITSSFDQTARLWQVDNGQPLHVFRGHTSGISHADINPEGTLVVTGSRDNTARLWDLKTGAPIQTLVGHTSAISFVTFSPDGQMIITASDDNTARLWPIFPTRAALINYANQIVPRCLTATQRQQFLLPNSKSQTLIHQGQILARQGQIRAATQAFQKAKQIEPCHSFEPKDQAKALYAETFLAQGKELAQQSQISAAIAAFNQAQQIDDRIKMEPESYAQRLNLE